MKCHVRSLASSLGMAALIALLAPAGTQAGAGVCQWGGTPTARTGMFTITPLGLRLQPSNQPLHLDAVGALTGDDPRCVGTMTLDAEFDTGASCFGFTYSGDVIFHDSGGNIVDRGIARFVGGGGAHSRDLLLSPDGDVVATVDPFARSNDQLPFTGSCASEAGLAEGTFSSTTGLVFLE